MEGRSHLARVSGHLCSNVGEVCYVCCKHSSWLGRPFLWLGSDSCRALLKLTFRGVKMNLVHSIVNTIMSTCNHKSPFFFTIHPAMAYGICGLILPEQEMR
jgi:hypothetical protein